MEKKINLKIFNSKKNIEIQSLGYGLNLFLPTFVLISSSFFREYVLAAELGIIIGTNIIFTQIFSANLRSIIISKNNSDNIYSYLVFRLIISIFIIIINIVIFLNYNFINTLILIQITLLIVIQWMCELILTFYELKNYTKKFLQYCFISFIFIILILVSFLYNLSIIFILVFFNLLLILFLINSIYKINRKKLFLKKIFFNIIKSSSFFSSLSISLSNLVWRILIISFCGKILAGIFFSSFALGSLPGTLFNNSFGPSMIKKNLKINYVMLIKFIWFFLTVISLTICYLNKDKIFYENEFTMLFGITISMMGSSLMLKGLFYRQFLIQNTNFKSFIFKYDIFYSFIICLIVPFLYMIGGANLIIFSFFTSSFTSYLMYRLIFQKLKNIK